MSIWEYDGEKHMAMERAEGRTEGRAEGEARGIYILINTLCSMGETFEDAIKKAAEQFDMSEAEIQEIMADKMVK